MFISNRQMSATSGAVTQPIGQIIGPLNDDTRSVDDDADTACTDDVIAEYQVRLVDLESRTMAVQVLQRDPEELLAATYPVLGLLEDAEYVDCQFDPVANRFT